MFKKLFLTAALLTLITSSIANNYPGYVLDSSGKLVHDRFGNCVKTGTWVKENLIEECGGPKKTTAPQSVLAPLPTPIEVKPLPPSPVFESETLPAPELNKPFILNASVLFAFDKSNLSEAGKNVLTLVAAHLKNDSIEAIKLDGYTDRIGTEKYNLKLSQKRADTVKNFLISNGIDVTKIKSVGHGETNFQTNDTDCKEFKGDKLKACYSKDRRVELTIS